MAKRVVVGAGRSGLAVAAFLARQGDLVIVTDARSEVPEQVATQLTEQGILAVWGAHPLALLDDCTEVVLSPGIPPRIAFVQEAHHRGIPVIGELELAHRVLRARDPEARLLAITGTNGKSTTTDLVAHLLRAEGLPAIACGNLGTPLIEALEGASPGTRFALECSSYQLETVQEFHAEAAALLNLTPDHLARHGSMAAYLAAKQRVFERQGPQAVRITPLGKGLADAVAGEGQDWHFGWAEPEGPGAWCDASGQLQSKDPEGRITILVDRRELRIPGDHNVENALAAVLLAWQGGAGVEALRCGLRSYPGLAHRIAFCGERNGVRAFNDSKGTNVDATVTAIQALPGPLVLLLGGEDKGSSYAPLEAPLSGKLRSLVFLGDAIPMLERDLGHLPHVSIWNFDEATAKALSLAQPGDQVLLSPACASFDQFKNFEHRGDHFEALARAWVAAP